MAPPLEVVMPAIDFNYNIHTINPFAICISILRLFINCSWSIRPLLFGVVYGTVLSSFLIFLCRTAIYC